MRQRLARWEMKPSEVTGAWKEKRRLAAAMRVVISRLVETDAPEAELKAAADALERYAERLAAHPRARHFEGFAETSPAGDTGGFFDRSPLIGLSNPLSPPIELRADEDRRRVHGRAVFGSAYEGPPGHVHGGYVAAAFDEVLGFANALSGNPGMTGTLTIRYRQPTPLHTELRFEALYDRSEGRKIFTSGQLYAGETLCAEAEGLFIAVNFERFRAFFEASQKREKAEP
ncbi:MAG TPA: PaaI family thioesterase [Myxococcota bacterium]|nr:PaaI family thioesterase [Myxococcota bacterium]